MAVTVTQITGTGAGSNPYRAVFDIVATADGDTTATITHGLTLSNLVPAAGGNGAVATTIPQALNVTIIPLLVAPALLSGWAWTNTSNATTTVVLTKATTASSGNAGAQVRVIIERAAVNGQ